MPHRAFSSCLKRNCDKGIRNSTDHWRGITAPVLQVMSSDMRPNAPSSDPEVMAHRRSFFRNLRCVTIPQTGHNLHHDAPEAVADMIASFLAGQRQRQMA